MGILLRQSFWSTIVIYFGVVLGFINSIILFPSFLDTEQIGLIRQIISASTLLIPITTFGVNSAYVKFYPFFKDSISGKKEFFSFNFFIVIISYVITSSLTYIFFDEIKFIFTEKSDLFIDYFYVVYFILFILSISALFESYLRARYETVVSNIVNGVSNRFFTAITILLLSQSIINFNELINLQIAIYSFGILVLIYHSHKKDNVSFTFKFPEIRPYYQKILNFSSYAFLGSFSNIIVLNVDVLMVTSLLGLSQTGIYTTAFYIGVIIEIPRRAISQISIPFISENIKNQNFNKIEVYYREISLHQTLIGVLFYLLIIINLDQIFNLIPNYESFISGKNVVYIIGFTKLIIMFFSFNSEIISLSKYYRFTVITIIILAIISIALNLLLIPIFGIEGAAYASLISISIFNLVKFIFLKIKMKISPFSNKSIIVLLIGILLFLMSFYFPNFDNPFINIIYKSFIITFLYLVIVILLGISKDFNFLLKRWINETLFK